MFDWQTIVALGALALSTFVVFSRAIDRGLTLREHEEYKQGVATRSQIRDEAIAEAKRHIEERLIIREFNDWRNQISRDFDRIEDDLRLIDSSKPSTGELQVALKAVDIRVTNLEEMIRVIKNNSNS